MLYRQSYRAIQRMISACIWLININKVGGLLNNMRGGLIIKKRWGGYAKEPYCGGGLVD